MKQFGTILNFELKGYLKNKIFIGVTLFLVLLITAVIFYPNISQALFQKNDSDDTTIESPDNSAEPGNKEDLPVMLISAGDNVSAETISQVFSQAFTDYNVNLTSDTTDKIKTSVTEGDAECAFIINTPTSYTYYVNNLSMYDSNTEIADEILLNVYRVSVLSENGIPQEKIESVMSAEINGEVTTLGKDQMQNFFYTYIMIFALYMVILLYGQMVATNVATEKSSRAMELLITSAKPTSMMFGKVMASCIAGLVQLIAVFGSAFIFFNLNRSYWSDNMIVTSIFDMPIYLLIYMLVFFLLGFLIYAFMFGAIGSTASKLEDINTSVMPVTMLFIVGFLVVMFSMSSGNVDNIVMKICSFIPFTSPMAMFTRIAMSSVSIYEIAISILILCASVVGIGVIAAKIYRIGVILYGTPPKPKAIFRALRKS